MNIHYLDPNPGGSPAILLLHGLGATSISWFHQLQFLTESGYRAIAPDIPGFGQSGYEGHGWNIPSIASSMVNLLDQLEINSAHVVGLSMGGVIAQQIAHNHPGRVNKLVLASTFAVLRPETMNGWVYFGKRAITLLILGLRAQAHQVAMRVFPRPEQGPLRDILEKTITDADKRAYRSAMISLGKFDSRHWLSEITAETLIISGEEDTTVTPEQQTLLKNGIPRSQQVIVKGAGHAVCIDQVNEFNSLLLQFVTQL